MFAGKVLSKIDKFGVWVLLSIVLAFIFTGYGMTKHLMDPLAAKYIHTQILPLPLLIFFCIHILKAVRNQFKKWNIFKNEALVDAYSYAITLIVTLVLIWMYFR
ncbi:MAG: hypothetical protein HQL12_08950 [Candidatus Omnitrophica bacterium]|nr:hypothetical protein [Candidatus Omnitrophota bacterium]